MRSIPANRRNSRLKPPNSATIDALVSHDNTFSLRWTPAHRGTEGNKAADEAAKSAAEKEGRGERRAFHISPE